MNKIKASNKLVSVILFALNFFLFTAAGHAAANQNSSITFKWQANPANENILGYRMYYGTESRFNSDNSSKPNFTYNQVVDLTEMLRCYGPDYTTCENISEDQLQCINLNAENPKCTLFNLNGTHLFFAMTAYSNVAESQYTPELKWSNASIIALQEVVRFLLLSEE